MTLSCLNCLPHNAVLNHLLTGVMLVDESFRIVDINATLEQMLSASLSQILHCSVFDIFTCVADEAVNAAHILQQQFEHSRATHQSFIYYQVVIQGINQPILVDYGVTPVADDTGFYYVIEVWAKDRHSRIEQEKLHHQQHHMTRQLIRSMAHEVKNPLAGILGASQLLQKNIGHLSQLDTAKLDKVHTYLTIIMDETRRLNALVNQLLGSPKLPNWQPINIHEPLEHVLALVNVQHPDITLVRDYDLSLPEIVADKDQLVQVLLNLVNNAVQALVENQSENTVGSPAITLRTRIDYQQTIGEVRHKSVMKLSVIDNGPGIDSELLPTIFYPLVTGRATGTGLGLALVHDIVERHHGMITVTSKKGETAFHIMLPWQQPI